MGERCVDEVLDAVEWVERARAWACGRLPYVDPEDLAGELLKLPEDLWWGALDELPGWASRQLTKLILDRRSRMSGPQLAAQ